MKRSRVSLERAATELSEIVASIGTATPEMVSVIGRALNVLYGKRRTVPRELLAAFFHDVRTRLEGRTLH